MSFVLYDLTFLVAFTLAVALFLYKRRSKLQRQGLLYLYRTSFGLKVIDSTSKKFAKILRPLQYVVVACGYFLMVIMIWLLVQLVRLYTSNAVVRETKIPPILPLVPYLPELFKVDFLPPFYFTYWIVIIAVVAITHEFAHGIFARLNNIKVHATGFGFLGPFLAAFVEPDEKHMQKAKKFTQLAILAAGTFANVLMTILFGAILWIFFAAAFIPAGVAFNAYSTGIVNVSQIDSVNGIPVGPNGWLSFEINDSLQRVSSGNRSYLVPGEILRQAGEQHRELIAAYEDAPAINAQLTGPILAIDGVRTTTLSDLRYVLNTHQPGQTVEILTVDTKDNPVTLQVKLGNREGHAYLGIGINEPARGKLFGYLYSFISLIKDPFVYYIPRFGGDFVWFVYDLLWWMVIINISVALMNMLPVGIFDGGRFFYLTVLGITKKEKVAKWAFSATTYAALAVFVWMTLRWFWVFFS